VLISLIVAGAIASQARSNEAGMFFAVFVPSLFSCGTFWALGWVISAIARSYKMTQLIYRYHVDHKKVRSS
jgi:hypothetical protein